jgi:ribosome-associated protein
MTTFYLEEKTHIELCKLLKKFGVCFSKSEAKDLIKCGLVSVNGIIETRKKAKIWFGDVIEVYDEKILVE